MGSVLHTVLTTNYFSERLNDIGKFETTIDIGIAIVKKNAVNKSFDRIN